MVNLILLCEINLCAEDCHVHKILKSDYLNFGRLVYKKKSTYILGVDKTYIY